MYVRGMGGRCALTVETCGMSIVGRGRTGQTGRTWSSLDVNAGFVDVMNAVINIINVFILLIVDHLLDDLPDNQYGFG